MNLAYRQIDKKAIGQDLAANRITRKECAEKYGISLKQCEYLRRHYGQNKKRHLEIKAKDTSPVTSMKSSTCMPLIDMYKAAMMENLELKLQLLRA